MHSWLGLQLGLAGAACCGCFCRCRRPARPTLPPSPPTPFFLPFFLPSQDVFYPEFEQIRATGMLPTGKPVPLPAFSHGYGGAGGVPGAAPGGAYPPYGAHPAAPQQPAAAGYGGGYGGGYAGAPRPTIVVPQGPLAPAGYGYSPAARPGMPSPGAYSSSAYSPAGSGVSPAGAWGGCLARI